MAVLRHNRALMVKKQMQPPTSLISMLPLFLYVSPEYKKGSNFPELLSNGYMDKKAKTRWTLTHVNELLEGLNDLHNDLYPELSRKDYVLSSRYV